MINFGKMIFSKKAKKSISFIMVLFGLDLIGKTASIPIRTEHIELVGLDVGSGQKVFTHELKFGFKI
jgi:hypothetical protein